MFSDWMTFMLEASTLFGRSTGDLKCRELRLWSNRFIHSRPVSASLVCKRCVSLFDPLHLCQKYRWKQIWIYTSLMASDLKMTSQRLKKTTKNWIPKYSQLKLQSPHLRGNLTGNTENDLRNSYSRTRRYLAGYEFSVFGTIDYNIYIYISYLIQLKMNNSYEYILIFGTKKLI